MIRTLVLALSVCVVACGPAESSGTDAGQQSQDAGLPAPEDQCTGAEDFGYLTEEIEPGFTGRDEAREAAGDCGISCLSAAAPDQCAIECMKSSRGVELSDGCAGCYGGIVLCTIDKCLQQCISDPQAEICKTCQEDKGCQAAFDTCSGLE